MPLLANNYFSAPFSSHSVPVNLVKRTSRRIGLTWNWTKTSARAVLPWTSSESAH
jgi:hypothetical protein